MRKWSTIRVGGRIYSVPSRLIGHTVEARQHPSTVEVLYGGRVLCTMPRLRGSAEHRIDYRHIHREPGPEAGRQAGHSVLCAPAHALVQELLGAKRDLDLPRALRKLDLYEVILLDDLGYVSAEPGRGRGAVHAARAERYERRSVMVTSNLGLQPVGPDLPRPDGAGRRDRPPRTPRRRA